MTTGEFEEALDKLLPYCSIEVDLNGQIVIYTGRFEADNGEMKMMHEDTSECPCIECAGAANDDSEDDCND